MSIKRRIISIAIVDDDVECLEEMEEFLSMKGYVVDTFQDSSVALSAFSNNEYDFLITDLEMPKIDGYELLAIIRKKYRNISIIIITGCAEKAYDLKNEHKDEHKFLIKPVNMLEICEAIEDVYCHIIEEGTQDYELSLMNTLQGNYEVDLLRKSGEYDVATRA